MLRPRSRALHRWAITAFVSAAALTLVACETSTLNVSLPTWLGGQGAPASGPPIDVTQPPPVVAPRPPAPPEPEIVLRPPGAPEEVVAEPSEPEPALPETPEVAEPAGPVLKPPVLESPAPIKAALLVPLRGPDARIGQALLDAAQLAVFDVGDDRFVLLPKDTGGTPEGARIAIAAALEDGAEIILGPLFSHSVAAVASMASGHGVNIVAFSTDRTVARVGVFLMGIMPEQQINRVVSFARTQGLMRVAALIPASAYGDTILGALRRAALHYGIDIVQVEAYAPGADDVEPILRLANYHERHAALEALRAELQENDDEDSQRALRQLAGLDTLGELGYDAIVLPAGGEELRELAPLLAFYDIDPDKVRYLGTTLWDDPTIGFEPSLVGGWFAGPPLKESQRFQDHFAAVYGHKPPRIASLAYDATALAAVLARAPAGADFSAQALTAASGFAGTDGIFRFRPDGIAERGLAVIEVRPHSFRVVNTAPNTFEKIGF